MAEDAHALYQTHLDVVSDAVWRRSHSTLARHVDGVLDIETLDKMHLRTPRAQAIGNLIAFRRAMEGIGATAYHRLCLDAAFAGEDRIEGRHRTYVLRGGNYAIDPYECDMVLRLRDGVWMMSDTRVSRRHLGSASFTDLRDDPATPTLDAGLRAAPADIPILRTDE